MSGFFISVFIYLFSLSIGFAENTGNTELKLFRAFGKEKGQSVLTVEKTMTGRCEKGSKISQRSDVWHCQTRSDHYDPCFVQKIKVKTFAICPATPWSMTGLKINFPTMIDNEFENNAHATASDIDMSTQFPWAIELDTGEKCLLVINNANTEAEASYHCDNKSFLFGPIQRCKPHWAINKKGEADESVQPAFIKRVWF